MLLFRMLIGLTIAASMSHDPASANSFTQDNPLFLRLIRTQKFNAAISGRTPNHHSYASNFVDPIVGPMCIAAKIADRSLVGEDDPERVIKAEPRNPTHGLGLAEPSPPICRLVGSAVPPRTRVNAAVIQRANLDLMNQEMERLGIRQDSIHIGLVMEVSQQTQENLAVQSP
jgi:hypothetical protein